MLHRVSRLAAIAAVAVSTAAAPATAQVFTGTTVGGQTWNRPVQGNPPVPPPSGVGTNVAFSTLTFRVSTAGAYSFLSEGVTPTNWDNYLFLYSGSFNPLTPFANVIIGNDDFPTIGLSGFDNVNLSTGVNYILVTTGFNNADAGAFRNTIRGPGTATVIPEPSSYALVATGLAGLALVRRRRRTA